jgi:bifunctional DNA-binding transcriptional regulator/antitoxin component of YhaV-PrlF toxin-antitoxin module
MPIFERRRIYAAGHSLAITLPKNWLAYFGLKAGDTVQVIANGEITISPPLPTESGIRDSEEEKK